MPVFTPSRYKHSIYLVLTSLFTACVSSQNPPVPGLEEGVDISHKPPSIEASIAIGNTVVTSDEVVQPAIIKETTILEALKCQMVRGFQRVSELKIEMPNNMADLGHREAMRRRLNSFNFQNGSGTLSGKMQVKTINGLTFNVAFPFGGFDRSDEEASAPGTGTPKTGRTLTGTNVQEAKRTFDISPDYNIDDLALCDQLEAERIDVGSFITETIVSAFTSFAGVRVKRIEEMRNAAGILTDQNGNPLPAGSSPQYRVIPFNPGLTSTITETTTSFTLVENPEGGFEIKVVPTAPRLNESTFGATFSQEDTGVYTVTTKLPTKVPENSDSRRLIHCLNDHDNVYLRSDVNYGGNVALPANQLCVEEPYTDGRYSELKNQVLASRQTILDAEQAEQDLQESQAFLQQQIDDGVLTFPVPQETQNVQNLIEREADDDLFRIEITSDVQNFQDLFEQFEQEQIDPVSGDTQNVFTFESPEEIQSFQEIMEQLQESIGNSEIIEEYIFVIPQQTGPVF